MPVAEFYSRLIGGLRSPGIDISMNTEPFDLPDEHTVEIWEKNSSPASGTKHGLLMKRR